jgi:glycosyltransferase involved in cell wall biosynthesis
MNESADADIHRGRGKKSNRVLMIAAAFPPTGGPGVQRSAKFAKYLPQFGWQPLVWCMADPPGFPSDATLANDLPESVIVHSVPDDGTMRKVRKTLGKWMDSGVASRLAAAADWRLDRFDERTAFPDRFAPWAWQSVDPLCELIAEAKVDVIYSTFSPASNHLLAMTLKEKTQLPWIADFRDLWTDDYRYREPSPSRRKEHRQLEQRILEAADVVVGVTQPQTEILAGHVPDRWDKFVTITNGFDPAEFPGTEPSADRGDRFVLAHVGRFDQWRANDALLEGMACLLESIGEQCGAFEFHAVGHCSEKTRARVVQCGVPATFTGYVTHGEAVAEMRRADALLVSINDGPRADTTIPGKLFEYLAAGRPILVVGPEGGACEEIVHNCSAGLVANLDASAVAGALGALFRAWRAGRPYLGCDPRFLHSFTRYELTRKLASLMNLLIRAGLSSKQQMEDPAEVGAV